MTTPISCQWCGDRPGGCLMCTGLDKTRATGELRRDAGMHRVAAHDLPWASRAYEWVLHLPHGQRFDASDLIEAIGRPDHPNAVGANFNSWAKARLITSVGWVQAANIKSNASQIQVWMRL